MGNFFFLRSYLKDDETLRSFIILLYYQIKTLGKQKQKYKNKC